MVSPSLPQPASPGQVTGICDGRSVAFQSGFIALEVVDHIQLDLAGDLQACLVRVRRALLRRGVRCDDRRGLRHLGCSGGAAAASFASAGAGATAALASRVPVQRPLACAAAGAFAFSASSASTRCCSAWIDFIAASSCAFRSLSSSARPVTGQAATKRPPGSDSSFSTSSRDALGACLMRPCRPLHNGIDDASDRSIDRSRGASSARLANGDIRPALIRVTKLGF